MADRFVPRVRPLPLFLGALAGCWLACASALSGGMRNGATEGGLFPSVQATGGLLAASHPAPRWQEPAPDAAQPEAAPASAPKKNLLEWLYESLGLTYIFVFLVLSFILVALVVMNILSARRENICPSQLMDNFEAQLNEKRYQEAYELAKADDSFLGSVLSAGLAKLSASYQHAIEAMQEVGEEENMKLEHRLSYIALIGTLSPMIGLFGTVDGMIRSFWVIATAGGTPNPAQLAEGISTALLTTLIGLAIAIPAIAIYNILRNRVQRLVLEVGITSEELMCRFENVGKK